MPVNSRYLNRQRRRVSFRRFRFLTKFPELKISRTEVMCSADTTRFGVDVAGLAQSHSSSISKQFFRMVQPRTPYARSHAPTGKLGTRSNLTVVFNCQSNLFIIMSRKLLDVRSFHVPSR